MSAQTSKLEQAVEALPVHPVVQDAQVTDDRIDGGRRLEVVLTDHVKRVPPGVLRMLAECDCGIAGVQPQGSNLIVEVI